MKLVILFGPRRSVGHLPEGRQYETMAAKVAMLIKETIGVQACCGG
jgi:hypothetical protein